MSNFRVTNAVASQKVPYIFFGTSSIRAAFLFQASHPAALENLRRNVMLGWAITFLVIALIAAVFGFGGIASASAGIAQVLFFIFLILFVVALVARAVRGRPPV